MEHRFEPINSLTNFLIPILNIKMLIGYIVELIEVTILPSIPFSFVKE